MSGKKFFNFEAQYLLNTALAEYSLACGWGYLASFWLPFLIWSSIAGMMGAVATLRLYQYLAARNKIHALNKSNYYSVTSDELKQTLSSNPDKILLGKGYIWENKHIQAYQDILSLPDRSKIINPELEAGGYEFLHNLGRTEEKDVIVPRDELQHTLIAGTTRVGKTRLLELLAYQLTYAEEPIIIVDPKGDPELLNSVYDACVDCGIEDQFEYFSLAHTSRSAKFNPLTNYGGASDIADRIASILPTGGNSEPFVKFAWQVIETISSVLIATNQQITLEKLQKYSFGGMQDLVDEGREKIKDLPQEARPYAKKCIDNLEIQAKHPKDHYQKMITSLGPILSSLNSGDAGILLNADVEESLQWRKIIEGKKVVYFYLASMLKGEVANNTGKMIVQDLLYYIGEVYAFSSERKRVNLMVDEFFNVVFPGYVDILNKAGGAGLRVFLSMQTTSDIVSSTSMSMAKQILGNINNKIYLRVPEKELAEEFCSLFGKTNVYKRSQTRQVASDAKSDSELFRSGLSEQNTLEDVDLIGPEMIMHLPKGQAFAYSQARDPYKVRIPLLDKDSIKQNRFAERLNDFGVDISDIQGGPSLADVDGARVEWERKQKRAM